MKRPAEKQLPLEPGIAALVDLLVEFAVDDFFAELEKPRAPLEQSREVPHEQP